MASPCPREGRILALMKILHLSDLHGRHMRDAEGLIARWEPDWIVLTGDILPDFHMISGSWSRLACQRDWWRTYRRCFRREGAILTLTLGNHEIEGFRDRESEAVPAPLAGKVGILQGNPAEFGAWGFAREYEAEALQREVDALVRPLVVLGHCPPYGILDTPRQGGHIGHPPFRTWLDEAAEPPLLVLCGHVHEAFGQVRRGRSLIVNAATGHALIDLDLRRGTAEVVRMARFGPDPEGSGEAARD